MDEVTQPVVCIIIIIIKQALWFQIALWDEGSRTNGRRKRGGCLACQLADLQLVDQRWASPLSLAVRVIVRDVVIVREEQIIDSRPVGRVEGDRAWLSS